MRLALAAVLAVALAGLPARAAETADDGWAAYQARRFADAVRLWLSPARAGDPRAAFGLGLAYDLGQGVRADQRTACLWYRRGGAAGDVSAMFNAAALYDSGRCGPRRADLAGLWYARAAAFGYGRAQFVLGQLYAAGDGVPRNPDQAAGWYRAALASGITAAADRVKPPARPAGIDAAPLLAATPVSPDDSQADESQSGEDQAAGSPANADQAGAGQASAGQAGGDRAGAGHAGVGQAPAVQAGGSAPGNRPDSVGEAPAVAASLSAGAGVASPVRAQATPPIAPLAAPRAVALVWNAPEQPEAVRFFVELLALDAHGTREVMARYVDLSAQRSPPLEPGAYAWRVLTVTRATARGAAGHYVAAPWRHFTIAARR